jgi:hypothetical protein
MMGLRAMGIADDIVDLAFLLTFGAVAVAAARSFGLVRSRIERKSGRFERGEIYGSRGYLCSSTQSLSNV